MVRAKRRGDVRAVFAETTGSLVLASAALPFALSARADRLDDEGASLVVADDETGTVPDATQRLRADGRRSCRSKPLSHSATGDFRTYQDALSKACGTSGRPAANRPVKSEWFEPAVLAELADGTRRGLERLIAELDNPNTPYRAIRRPGYGYDYDAYAHLARVAEWSAHVDEEASS